MNNPKLPEILADAYDMDALGREISNSFLHRSQRLAALVPLRANLMKDSRLVFTYRAEITSDTPGESTSMSLHLHYAGLGESSAEKNYRDLTPAAPCGLVPDLRRYYLRRDRNLFVTAFPCDPELPALAKILKPGVLLNRYNEALLPSGAPPARAVQLRFMSYRPERRVVFQLRAIDERGNKSDLLLKLYRRGQAKRLWKVCKQLNYDGKAEAGGVCFPLGADLEHGMLLYPFIPGATLHELQHSRLIRSEIFEATSQALSRFHGLAKAVTDHDSFNRFTVEDELMLLERWRRFFRLTDSEHHGILASMIGKLEKKRGEPAGPEAVLHRDFYPKQVIVQPYTGALHIVDVDTMALGPRALDFGNFLAHVQASVLEGADTQRASKAQRAFLRGVGANSIPEEAIRLFHASTLIRLICLNLVSPSRGSGIDPLRNWFRKVSN